MAQVGELVIGLSGDARSWSNALDKAGKELGKLTAKVDEAGIAFRKFNAENIGMLKEWGGEIGSTYGKFEQSLIPVKQGLVDQGKALSVNERGINTLAIQTVTASEKFKTLTTSLKSTSSALWLMTRGLQQFGMAMTMSFTVPIMGALAYSIKTFTEWEKGTLKIQSAAEMTREAAEKITNSFMEISTQVPLTVEELQKAGFAAAQAGVTGEKAIINFAEAAVMLSKVGGDAFKDLPIEDLANRLAKLGIAFGETGENWENINKIASTLLVVAKAVPGGLAEVIEAMRRVAGTATTLNLSLADTTALMGTLVAAGVPAARAGTELASGLLDLITNLDDVGSALGYTTGELGKLRDRIDTDLMGVLDELIRRYGLIASDTKKAEQVQEIFGRTSLKALLPLIEHYDIFRDLQARANQEIESGALLAAEFNIQASSLSGTMTVFRNSLVALGKVVGDDLAPFINYFLKTFTLGIKDLIKSWQNLDPLIKYAVILMAGLLAVVGPLALLLNTLFLNPISGLVTFITFLTKASGQLVLQTGLASMAGQSMGYFALSLGTVATAIRALVTGLAILAVKFAAILVVIGAVTFALYKLGQFLGIRFKLPEMPAFKLPTYKGIGAPKLVPEEVETEEAVKADEKAAKEKEKQLSRELRDKRKARDKELKILDKGIKEYEKLRDAEIKERQKMVDEQKYALDERREQWEEERRLADERIRIQEEIVETAKDTLKLAKKELDELKKARDRELDIAEGRVDYAKMNLEAAQNALKREKILGRDEFDATFRAAEARVKTWEDVVQLAQENVIKVKQEYQKQLDAQEDIVDATQDQVDLQAGALDDLRDALDKRRAIVDKEIDVLQDELNIRQQALDSIKEATQEKLNLLREERDVRQEAWDDELDILQEQLDAARDLAQDIAGMPIPELPDLAGTIGELDQAIQDEIEDIQSRMKEAFKFGFEIEKEAPGMKILTNLQEIYDRWNEFWYNKMFGEGFWAGLKIEAEERGVGLRTAFLSLMFEGLQEKASEFFGSIFSEENFNTAKSMLSSGWQTVQTQWGNLWSGLKDTLSPGLDAVWQELSGWWGRTKVSLGTIYEGSRTDWENYWGGLETSLGPYLEGLKESFGILWADFKRGWEDFKESAKIAWEGMKNIINERVEFIRNLVSGRLESMDRVWDETWNRMKRHLEGVWSIIKGVIQIAWGIISGIIEVGLALMARNWEGVWEGLRNSFRNIWEGIKSIVNGFIMWFESVTNFSSVIKNWEDLLRKAKDWGKDFIDNLTKGIREKIDDVKRWGGTVGSALEKMLGASSPPKEGPLHEIDKWGANLVKAYAESISKGIPYLSDVLKDINLDKILGSTNLNEVLKDISGTIGTSFAGGASVAIPEARTIEAQQQIAGPAVTKNYYIQPGQMIATRGELRNFVRMLKEYDQFEEQR